MFHNLLKDIITFVLGILLYLASLKLSWVAVLGVVGKSDLNENPVVSLDLDFGLRLRVCQHQEMHVFWVKGVFILYSTKTKTIKLFSTKKLLLDQAKPTKSSKSNYLPPKLIWHISEKYNSEHLNSV